MCITHLQLKALVKQKAVKQKLLNLGMIEKEVAALETITEIKAKDVMSANPQYIGEDMLVIDALDLMRKNNITQLMVAEDKVYKGIIHLHDILKEGIL